MILDSGNIGFACLDVLLAYAPLAFFCPFLLHHPLNRSRGLASSLRCRSLEGQILKHCLPRVTAATATALSICRSRCTCCETPLRKCRMFAARPWPRQMTARFGCLWRSPCTLSATTL